MVSDKLDGISGILVRESGETKLYTRGNGRVGQDISHAIEYFAKVIVSL